MKTPPLRPLDRIRGRGLPLLTGMMAVAGFLIAGSSSAPAFTAANADTAMNSFNNVYYVANGGNGFFKNDQNGESRIFGPRPS